MEQFELKDLIADMGCSQRDFLTQFNGWLKEQQKNGKYLDQPKEGFISPDFSRWITGKVKMRKAKLDMFAEYFGIAPEQIINAVPKDQFPNITLMNDLLGRLLNGGLEITINIKFKEGEINGNTRQ